MKDVLSFAESRCVVTGSIVGLDGTGAVDAKAERFVIFGGDGTLIGVARSLGKNQIPLIGVNVGKLGFLTEFSIDEFKNQFDRILNEDELISKRSILHVTIERNGGICAEHIAINDCVIQAGTPFRLIHLGISVNDEHLTEVGGDGIIICTPSGSTAHNMSAGGPIMQPGVNAIIITPMNPHSLTHKPLIVECDSVIRIQTVRVNEGTTAIVDGQVASPLLPGDIVTVRRFDSDFLVVRNPQYTKSHKLVSKLHWGKAPNFS